MGIMKRRNFLSLPLVGLVGLPEPSEALELPMSVREQYRQYWELHHEKASVRDYIQRLVSETGKYVPVSPIRLFHYFLYGDVFFSDEHDWLLCPGNIVILEEQNKVYLVDEGYVDEELTGVTHVSRKPYRCGSVLQSYAKSLLTVPGLELPNGMIQIFLANEVRRAAAAFAKPRHYGS